MARRTRTALAPRKRDMRPHGRLFHCPSPILVNIAQGLALGHGRGVPFVLAPVRSTTVSIQTDLTLQLGERQPRPLFRFPACLRIRPRRTRSFNILELLGTLISERC